MIISFLFLGAYIVCLSLIFYVIAFADTDADGWNGAFSRLLLIKAKSVVVRIVLVFPGGSNMLNGLHHIYTYCVHRPNPILQIGYLVLINSSIMAWFIFGAHLLPTYFIGTEHNFIAPAFGLICNWSFFVACRAGPGRITQENVQCYAHQPYDGLMFLNGAYCKSCKVAKPARSKHCSMCGFCVPLFDHHCVWLNQCIGEHNYRYFLTFLFLNGAFFAYAAVALFFVLISEIYEKELFKAVFVNRVTKKQYRATAWMLIQYVMRQHMAIVGIFLFASAMGLAVFGFLGYHLYLLYCGTTTNESFKLGSLRQVHKEMQRAHQRYNAALKDGTLPPELNPTSSSSSETASVVKSREECGQDVINSDSTPGSHSTDVQAQAAPQQQRQQQQQQLMHAAVEASQPGLAPLEVYATLTVEESAVYAENGPESQGQSVSDAYVAVGRPVQSKLVGDANNEAAGDETAEFTGAERSAAEARTGLLAAAAAAGRAADDEVVGCIPAAGSGITMLPTSATKGEVKRHIVRDVAEQEEELPEYLAADPGPFPDNIYRTGLFNGLKRAFCPPSQPALEALQRHKPKME